MKRIAVAFALVSMIVGVAVERSPSAQAAEVGPWIASSPAAEPTAMYASIDGSPSEGIDLVYQQSFGASGATWVWRRWQADTTWTGPSTLATDARAGSVDRPAWTISGNAAIAVVPTGSDAAPALRFHKDVGGSVIDVALGTGRHPSLAISSPSYFIGGDTPAGDVVVWQLTDVTVPTSAVLDTHTATSSGERPTVLATASGVVAVWVHHVVSGATDVTSLLSSVWTGTSWTAPSTVPTSGANPRNPKLRGPVSALTYDSDGPGAGANVRLAHLVAGSWTASELLPPGGTFSTSSEGFEFYVDQRTVLKRMAITDPWVRTAGLPLYRPSELCEPAPSAVVGFLGNPHVIVDERDPTSGACRLSLFWLSSGGGTPEDGFVYQVYSDFLHRGPDPDGERYWAGQVRSGALSRTDVVYSFARTDEWLGRVVDGYYLATLGRGPDASGRAYWIGQLRNGVSPSAVASLFYGSDEFFARSGGTVGAYVDALYLQLLHRPSDPSGKAYWVDLINSGTPRATAAASFYDSFESRSARVTDLYDALLARLPDAGGRDYWAGIIQTYGDISLAAFLAGSDEYFQRANQPL